MCALALFSALLLSQSLLAQTPKTSCTKADSLLAEFRFGQAISALEQCLQQDSSQRTLHQLAYCYYEQGNYPKAKTCYQRLLHRDSADQRALDRLGSIYLREDNYRKATDLFGRLIRLDSSQSRYHKKAAIAAYQSGRAQLAQKHYQHAHRLNPTDLSIITALSILYQQQQNIPQAQQMIRKGLQLDSTNTKLTITGAQLYFNLKQYDSSLVLLKSLLRQKQDTTIKMVRMLGLSYYFEKQYEKCIPFLEQFLEKDISTDIIHYYLGNAYSALEDTKNATFHYEMAAQEGVSENIATYFTRLGMLYESQKQFAKAIRAYQSAYDYEPSNALLYHLARNYDVYYKDKSIALDYYQRYLSLQDTGNLDYMDYSRQRATALREMLHFTDTLD